MTDESEYRYAKSHEWVSIDGDIATIGISEHAQEELGDVALVLFPEVGRVLQLEEKFGEIESIKAVSDLYAPVSGTIIAVNETLHNSPETVNDDPLIEGWMIKISMSQPNDVALLMDSLSYQAFLQEA